jgi:hypothetical protein
MAIAKERGAGLIRPGSAELRQLFATFQRSAFRLETLQSYGQSGEDPALDAFLAGQPYVRPAGQGPLAGEHRPGPFGRRDDEPRPHRPRAADGLPAVRSDVGVRAQRRGRRGRPDHRGRRGRVPWPAPLPQGYDYWLIDDRLYDMVYADDAARSWIGVDPLDNDTWVEAAYDWRDLALERAVPWRTYIESRPDLAAIVAAMN